jgi:hypothetical protein
VPFVGDLDRFHHYSAAQLKDLFKTTDYGTPSILFLSTRIQVNFLLYLMAKAQIIGVLRFFL